MIKSDEESKYYIPKLRKKIEILFLVADNFGLWFIRAVSKMGVIVKSIFSL